MQNTCKFCGQKICSRCTTTFIVHVSGVQTDVLNFENVACLWSQHTAQMQNTWFGGFLQVSFINSMLIAADPKN